MRSAAMMFPFEPSVAQTATPAVAATATPAAASVVDALLARHADFVSFVARRVGPAAAEDIVQAAYLRLLERGVQLRDERAILGWFYRVLRNAAVDQLRSSSRRARLGHTYADDVTLRDPQGDARDVIAGREKEVTCARLARELAAKLSRTHREALEIMYFANGSLADLAAREGVSRNTAAVRVHRARSALRTLLGGDFNCG